MNGFASLAAGGEAGWPTGWEAVVAPALSRDLDAHLVDNVTLRLGFPQAAAYDIAAPEPVAFTVPAEVRRPPRQRPRWRPMARGWRPMAPDALSDGASRPPMAPEGA